VTDDNKTVILQLALIHCTLNWKKTVITVYICLFFTLLSFSLDCSCLVSMAHKIAFLETCAKKQFQNGKTKPQKPQNTFFSFLTNRKYLYLA
jgi:hypothetical protein